MAVTRDELVDLFRVNLRSLREDAGITQSELARRIGSFPSVVCDMEAGRRAPTFATLAVLAEALGVTPAALLSTVRSAHSSQRLSAPA